MADFPDTRISLILRLGEPADVEAWYEFAEVYTPAIFRLAIRRGLQAADAEDVTQDVLFGVARAVERFEPDTQRARFRTWMARIARNLIADAYARQARRAEKSNLSANELDAELNSNQIDESWQADLEEEVASSILQLAAGRVRRKVSQDAWQAFELTALHGKTAETAATEMRTSVGAVYVARCRVLKLLKKESQRLMSEFEVDAADASSFTSLSEGAS